MASNGIIWISFNILTLTILKLIILHCWIRQNFIFSIEDFVSIKNMELDIFEKSGGKVSFNLNLLISPKSIDTISILLYFHCSLISCVQSPQSFPILQGRYLFKNVDLKTIYGLDPTLLVHQCLPSHLLLKNFYLCISLTRGSC